MKLEKLRNKKQKNDCYLRIKKSNRILSSFLIFLKETKIKLKYFKNN